MMELFMACTRDNANAAQLTTATMLAGHVQELMSGLPFSDPAYGSGSFGAEYGETLADYDDVDDYHGVTLNPPRDAAGQSIPALGQYQQAISVMPVYPKQLAANTDQSNPDIPEGTYTGAVRIRVRVLYRVTPSSPATEVYRTSWVRLDQ